MAHDKAAVSPLADRRLNDHVVAIARRNHELRFHIDHWNTGNRIFLQHVALEEAGALKQGPRAAVKILKIAREISNAGGVAIAPFNAYGFSIREHEFLATSHPVYGFTARPCRRRFLVAGPVVRNSNPPLAIARSVPRDANNAQASRDSNGCDRQRDAGPGYQHKTSARRDAVGNRSRWSTLRQCRRRESRCLHREPWLRR